MLGSGDQTPALGFEITVTVQGFGDYLGIDYAVQTVAAEQNLCACLRSERIGVNAKLGADADRT